MKFRQNSLEFTLTATEGFLTKSEEHFLKRSFGKFFPTFFIQVLVGTYNYIGYFKINEDFIFKVAMCSISKWLENT